MGDVQIARFGRYRVIAELGRGAMGVVYKAEDPVLNRTLAIKTILMSADVEERAEYEARFQQEAKAAGGLNHPNIITIHDVGREGDVAFMAMELLEGVALRDLMRQGQLPLSLALDIAAQVAEGLAFAHERGVIHRDIKPGNIMVVHNHQAKIMDFGIARVRLSDVKTQAGALLGSPKYMSPEQVAGLRTDHRSDIFSFGVTLYELVAGVAPFSAPEVGQLMYQVSTAAPRPPSSINPSLPTMIDLIVAKTLEKDPDGRYQNARDLAADLRACGAELDDRRSSTLAAGEATASLDLDLAKTTVDVEAAKIRVNTDGTKTRKLGGAATQNISMRLSPSRRFDSSKAVQRLSELATADSVVGTSTVTALPPPSLGSRIASATMLASTILNRWLQDPDQRTLTIAVIAAIVVALVIALF